MELGMIGLGRMGGNMVLRLLKGGHETVVYARDPAVVETHVKAGARGVTSLTDLVSKLSTPRVAWMMVPAGKPVGGSLEEARIGREVTLDLAQELFDTRIPPGETRTVRYVRTIEQPGLELKAAVVVAPDDFYVKFFEAIVPKAKTKRARTLLHQALDEARKSSFVLFEEEVGVS